MPRIRTLLSRFSVLLALGFGLAACSDPYEIRWTARDTTGRVYALSAGELNQPSGYSLSQRRAVIVEAPQSTGVWDFAVDVRDGAAVLLPPGAVGVTSEARILPVPGESYEGIRQAPGELDRYISDAPVPAVPGQLYVIRGSANRTGYGTLCFYYSKLVVTEVDVVAGWVEFEFDTNPACNDRNLRPHES